MSFLSFDIGGSSVKYAVIDGSGQILYRSKAATPATREEFINLLVKVTAEQRQQYELEGAGFSFPGAVDDIAGVIGGSSAVPYIHDFPIKQAIADALELPVAMENDANCAALGECWCGAGQGYHDVVLFVIGSGVGGAIVHDGQIRYGRHLHGGEFGYMLARGHHILSEVGSTRAMAEAVADAKGKPHEEMDGLQAFALADDGDPDAVKAAEDMYEALAAAIYDIQYSVDPDIFLLGGAISERPGFTASIERHIDKILQDVEVGRIRPQLAAAQHGNDANLLGAVWHLIDKIK